MQRIHRHVIDRASARLVVPGRINVSKHVIAGTEGFLLVPATCVGRKCPVHLSKAPASHQLANRRKRWVQHLAGRGNHHQPFRFRKFYDGICLCKGCRHGLLRINVPTVPKCLHDLVVVCGNRCGDKDNVDISLRDHLVVIVVRF